jgi:hypothetical protein
MTFAYRRLNLVLAAATLVASGCNGGGATTTDDAATTDDARIAFDAGPGCPSVPTYSQLLSATFVPRCSGRCHGGGIMPPGPTSPAGPIDLSASSDRGQLVDRASIYGMGLVVVVAGDPGSSFLLRKLTDGLPADGSLGNPMPQGEAIRWTMIPQAEIDAITCWIAGGAP